MRRKTVPIKVGKRSFNMVPTKAAPKPLVDRFSELERLKDEAKKKGVRLVYDDARAADLGEDVVMREVRPKETKRRRQFSFEITPELRERMDALGEGISWSATFRKHIEILIERLEVEQAAEAKRRARKTPEWRNQQRHKLERLRAGKRDGR